jgi:hypothetical protein
MVATNEKDNYFPSHFKTNESINQSDDGAKILHEIADPINHLYNRGGVM